ncbi:hypothetical protein [Scytonema millei]|nr:hypothetical protein [Scytonema millei]
MSLIVDLIAVLDCVRDIRRDAQPCAPTVMCFIQLQTAFIAPHNPQFAIH